jgi:hypothetical protein
MTDAGISEIYALMREAFRGGQTAIQLQAYPFKMTAENLVGHRLDLNFAFWRQLKEGSDRFEATHRELAVTVSGGRYTFQPTRSPEMEAGVLVYRAMEDDHEAVLLEEGRAAIRTTYADGGQHSSFTALRRRGVSLGDVSRPEALAFAGQERVIVPARPMGPDCVRKGPCQSLLPQARAVYPPNTGEPVQPDLVAQSPAMWIVDLPPLLTFAPGGAMPASLRRDQPMLSGADPILQANLTTAVVAEFHSGTARPGN